MGCLRQSSPHCRLGWTTEAEKPRFRVFCETLNEPRDSSWLVCMSPQHLDFSEFGDVAILGKT